MSVVRAKDAPIAVNVQWLLNHKPSMEEMAIMLMLLYINLDCYETLADVGIKISSLSEWDSDKVYEILQNLISKGLLDVPTDMEFECGPYDVRINKSKRKA